MQGGAEQELGLDSSMCKNRLQVQGPEYYAAPWASRVEALPATLSSGHPLHLSRLTSSGLLLSPGLDL